MIAFAQALNAQRFRVGLTLACLTLLVGGGGIARAEEEDGSRLAADPAAAGDWRDLQAAVDGLRRRVDAFGEDLRLRWSLKLDWDGLREAAAGNLTLDGAMALAKQFYGAEEGLEEPEFVRVRQWLDAYVERGRLPSGPRLDEEAAVRLERLRAALSGGVDDVQAVQEQVAWLAVAERLPSETLLEARRGASYPTVIVHFDRDLFAEKLREFQNNSERTRCAGNCIAGAWVTGPANVAVSVKADLPPASDAARVVLRIEGRVRTPANVAHKGNVRLFSSGLTEFTGEKIVHWRDGEIVAEPAVLRATTSAQLNDLDVPFLKKPALLHQVVENYAWKKARQTKPQGEYESARLAERQLGEEIDKEVAAKLGEANQKISGFFHSPLRRLGLATRITSAASERHLAVGFLAHDDPFALGAPAAPRPAPVEGKIQVMVHESMIGKITRRNAGGEWWTDYDFAIFQKELVGEYSHHFRLGPHFPKWALQFDWRRPLITRIGAERVTFELRGRAVRINEQTYREPFVISADYRLEITDYGIRFQRAGEVGVASLSGDSESDPLGRLPAELSPEVAQLLTEKFSDMFGPEVFLDGLMPPVGGSFDSLAQFDSRRLRLEPQWLTLGFESKQSQ